MGIRSSNCCHLQAISDVFRRKGVDPLVTHAGGLPLVAGVLRDSETGCVWVLALLGYFYSAAYLIILGNPANGWVERQTDRARVKSAKRPLAGEG
jgi:hypothetical protein